MADDRETPPSFESAVHAYEHTGHAGDRPPQHRVDLTEAPRWPAAQRPPAAPLAGEGPQERVVRHEVSSPGRLGFGFGFGFAAGVWTFRLLVTLVGVAALVLLIWQLLSGVLR